MAMELRKMVTSYEKSSFAECLTKARASRGVHFRETERSSLGRSHLQFGDVYAIFENEGEPPERMLGGFIMHDLATLPQSLPKPELSLPARSVIEGSDLWSLSKGAGLVAARAAAAVAGLRRAEAVLVYPIVRPVDLASFYLRFGFVAACEPVGNQFGETLDGGEIWVQPMILQGDALEAYVRWGLDCVVQSTADHRALRLDASIVTRTPSPEVSMPQPPEKRI
jgi:hypothetical protein